MEQERKGFQRPTCRAGRHGVYSVQQGTPEQLGPNGLANAAQTADQEPGACLSASSAEVQGSSDLV